MVSSLTRLRAVAIDLMIDLTILQEMAERQGDARRQTVVGDLMARLRDDVCRIKGFESNGKISDHDELLAAIEAAHRSFADSYDITHADEAITHMRALFSDAD